MIARSSNKTIFANNAQLAGHVHVGDWAIFGGYTGVHQFCRVGAHTATAVGTGDPSGRAALCDGRRQQRHALRHQCRRPRRRGFSPDALMVLETRLPNPLQIRADARRSESQTGKEDAKMHPAEIQPILDFLAVSKRGIIR